MKAKRILAWLLVCVLQLGVCLVIPLHGQREERSIAENGEPYRFALRSVSGKSKKMHTSVEILFPPPLPVPEDEMGSETIVQRLEVGPDGFARICERGATWQEAEQQIYPMVYDLYDQTATWLVSGRIRDDLEVLMQIMRDLRGYDPGAIGSTPGAAHFASLVGQIEEPALRDLAQKQIDAQNGDELFDSYVSGVLYEDAVYYQEVWVAGIHVATLHD